jgi:alkanesulfonate monooxygenase SsuD/methylene tetrahydromethanopterin reductase-like flavin-dependent oxidoreductase (luciferase family)
VFAADADREAQRLFTSAQQQFTNMVRNRRGKLQPPLDDIDSYWTPPEKAHVTGMLKYSFVGSPRAVHDGLEEFVQQTEVDEVMVVSAIFHHAARLRSYELLAEVFELGS